MNSSIWSFCFISSILWDGVDWSYQNIATQFLEMDFLGSKVKNLEIPL